MIGQTLGHYEILEPLGQGGMGVVYKARDRRLGRLAAIKVLPAARLSDEEGKRRFVREAKAASALNHPNIITIYGIDRAGDVDFIAMEHVAGTPLDRLIPVNGLRLVTALRYAVQIADALAVAHAAGVVHRDLKPGNVMVTDSGLVKVLDFGLAKLIDPPGNDQPDSGSTMTVAALAHTRAGMILGTIAYMSPEQAEGRAVDSRSDIFSFGSVLYEMVSGRKAFQGESQLSTLTAILREDPPRIGGLVDDLPAEVERVISRCLRKDPIKRFQHMADVKVALEELKEESESGKLHAAAAATGPGPMRERRWRPILAAALTGLALLSGLATFLRRPPGDADGTTLSAVALTTYPGLTGFPTFSPTGSQVAFMWNGPNQDNFDVYVKVVGEGPPLRLTSDAAEDYSPAWSPDGRAIAFLRDLPGTRLAVMLVAPIGGPERKLAEVSSRFAALGALAWTPDGKSLAVPDQDEQGTEGITLVSAETGSQRRLTSPPIASSHDYAPAFSPDGRALAFVRAKQRGADLFVVPLSSTLDPQGPAARLMSHDYLFFGVTWTLDARHVIAVPGAGTRSGSLWRIAADGSGARERLPFVGDAAANPSLSTQGSRLAYAHGTVEDRNIWRLDLTPGASQRAPARVCSSTRHDASAQFSPDGTRIAFHSSRSGNEEIWVCSQDGTSAVQVTALGGPRCGTPRWSPDGRQIVFDANPDGNWDIFMVPATGGAMRRLTTQQSQDAVPSWSHDGHSIYFRSDRGGTTEIWKMPLTGAAASQVTRHGGFAALESPDGGLLYYTKTDDGREGLWSVPVTGGQEARVIDAVIAARAFVVTGDRIYFIRGVASDGSYFVSRTATDTIDVHDLRTRRTRTLARVESPWLYLSVAPDGGSLLYSQNDRVDNELRLVEQFK